MDRSALLRDFASVIEASWKVSRIRIRLVSFLRSSIPAESLAPEAQTALDGIRKRYEHLRVRLDVTRRAIAGANAAAFSPLRSEMALSLGSITIAAYLVDAGEFAAECRWFEGYVDGASVVKSATRQQRSQGASITNAKKRVQKHENYQRYNQAYAEARSANPDAKRAVLVNEVAEQQGVNVSTIERALKWARSSST